MEIGEANTVLFQFANFFLFLSYLTANILFLRVTLAAASLCFILWGAFDLGDGEIIFIDTVVWNSVFMILNVGHTIYILYQMRPITFSREEYEW
jgi:Popeye protein conserved region